VERFVREEVFASLAGQLRGQKHDLPDPHVCCFSEPECEANLPHWAMYGRGGAGFALVFDGEALAKAENVDLAPVIYDQAVQLDRLQQVLTLGVQTCAAVRARAEKFGRAMMDQMHRISAHTVGVIMSMHAAVMKRPEFRFEREWRLVVSHVHGETQSDSKLAFGADSSGGILRSFFEFPFPPTLLREVVVGAAQATLNEPVAKMLLHYGDYPEADRPTVRTGTVALRVFT
jgi:hypothetical protein